MLFTKFVCCAAPDRSRCRLEELREAADACPGRDGRELLERGRRLLPQRTPASLFDRLVYFRLALSCPELGCAFRCCVSYDSYRRALRVTSFHLHHWHGIGKSRPGQVPTPSTGANDCPSLYAADRAVREKTPPDREKGE